MLTGMTGCNGMYLCATGLQQVIQVIYVAQVVQVVQVVQVIQVVIWFLWSKQSNYKEKLRCHARDIRTEEESGYIGQCSVLLDQKPQQMKIDDGCIKVKEKGGQEGAPAGRRCRD